MNRESSDRAAQNTHTDPCLYYVHTVMSKGTFTQVAVHLCQTYFLCKSTEKKTRMSSAGVVICTFNPKSANNCSF